MREFKLNNLRELSTDEQLRLQGGRGSNPCLEAKCGCTCTCDCADAGESSYSYKRETAQTAQASIAQRKITEAMNRW